MYDVSYDPWRRPATTFPPVAVWLYSRTLARLDYPWALLCHNWMQVVLALVCLLWSGSWMGIAPRRLAFTGLCLFSLLFLTPPALASFERGQTELYVLGAFFLLIGGVFTRRRPLFAAAGIVASLKWSAYPFLFMAGWVYLLSGVQEGRRLRESICDLAVLWIWPALTALPWLFPDIADYLREVRLSELGLAPGGVSQTLALPPWAAKLTPFAFALSAALLLRSPKGSLAIRRSLEVLLAVALVLSLTYGTICWEYRNLGAFGALLLLVSPSAPREMVFRWGLAFLLSYLARPIEALEPYFDFYRHQLVLLFTLAWPPSVFGFCGRGLALHEEHLILRLALPIRWKMFARFAANRSRLYFVRQR
jgi:hypothetical protein